MIPGNSIAYVGLGLSAVLSDWKSESPGVMNMVILECDLIWGCCGKEEAG